MIIYSELQTIKYCFNANLVNTFGYYFLSIHLISANSHLE